MKVQNSIVKITCICFVAFLMAGCVSTVQFAYKLQTPPETVKAVNSDAKVFLSFIDSREQTLYIGYGYNMYGMQVNSYKPKDPEILKSIEEIYRAEFVKTGFTLTEDEASSDLKIKLELTTFLAKMKPGMVDVISTADCCMKVSLLKGNDDMNIFQADLCGNGEKRSTMVGSKSDLPKALNLAADDLLNKILSKSDLIKFINSESK